MLNELSAAEAARAIREGSITSEDLVSACLERIAGRETLVQAWAHLNPELALTQARTRDKEAPRGPLHGVPIGIKDVMDTADMPTGYGSTVYDGYRPGLDAACVALLKAAGAVILGKTVSTEFAAITPGPTGNPHNPAHSPGGSSSGSAAAVADRMVPAALGSQTIGSTIRPATYCGVVGFKPSHGTFSMRGILTQAEFMDTLGLITRSVADVRLLSEALLACPDPFGGPQWDRPPRLGFARSPHWPDARPETLEQWEALIALLRRAGCTVVDVEMDQDYAQALDDQWTILGFESSRTLTDERINHLDGISPKFRELLERGMTTPFADYWLARQRCEATQLKAASLFDGVDALVTPAAAGEAPAGRVAGTDLLFQRLWTVLHLPAISLPGYRGPSGLPLGVQIIGPRHEDARLLAIAAWVEDLLRREVGPVPHPDGAR